ncbi:MAG: hypothetical protein HKM23_04870 [Nitrosopumilus sp.]|nr:hypothetical protein [Nitrosopumilus sp.]
MTDWTNNSNDDEYKFWNWMDKDKENYDQKHPIMKKQKTKKKRLFVYGIIGLALVIAGLGIFSGTDEFGSENYFYIPDYRLNKSPLFCAQDFSDPVFPNARDILLEKTSKAVKNWQNRIEQYTETKEVWNFEFRTISKDSHFEDFGCDATITFEQFPSLGKEVVRGETALSQYGFSDVVIFYLDPVSKDKIDPNIDMVITHEIGHVLGLGHPVFEGMYDEIPFYIDDDGRFWSRSVMITPQVYPLLPSNLIYTITDYDVRSVVNLYGGGISNTPIFFGYLNYIIITIVLVGIAFFVNKKLKEY